MMHWSKYSADAGYHGYYESNPVKLLPIWVTIFAHGDAHLKFCVLSCQSLDIFDTFEYT